MPDMPKPAMPSGPEKNFKAQVLFKIGGFLHKHRLDHALTMILLKRGLFFRELPPLQEAFTCALCFKRVWTRRFAWHAAHACPVRKLREYSEWVGRRTWGV